MANTIRQAYENAIFDQWGHLVDYWYPLVHLCDLRKNSLKKITAFNLNYIVWRNAQGDISVALDSCIHKQSPLSAGYIQDNHLVCPYHGWKFDHRGACTDIPYSNDRQDCVGKTLLTMPCKVEGNLVWFYPGKQEGISTFISHWQFRAKDIISTQVFECNEQALIENFMDSPHTNFVHTGLIRKDKKCVSRDIKIYLDEKQKLYVDHLANTEKLGPFNWFINPKKHPITHQDCFVAPSEIDIQYQFEKDKTNFQTHIMLCPIDQQSTRAFIKISCQFRWFNPLIRLGIRIFSPLVLWQDKKMVALQSKNISMLREFKGMHIDYDVYSYQVKLLREQAKTKKQALGLLTSIHYTSLKL